MTPNPEIPTVITQKPVSPTGKPLIPPEATKYVVGIGAIVVGLSQMIPPGTIGGKILQVLTGALALFGIASPGIRLGK